MEGIPRTIHYCWFGHGEKSKLMKECMESWGKYCPDWEIVEWNEDNFDVDFCPYAEKAYRAKKYGFLADAARLKIIYEHGGVYLDTDVELRNSLDELMGNDAWFGYGSDTEINTGSGFGAVPRHPFVKKLLDQYLTRDAAMPFEVCTVLDTMVFKSTFSEFASNHDVRQELDGVLVINDIWRYVIHHYTNTWMPSWKRAASKIQAYAKKIINK